MDKDKGLAYCGLACCVCSENQSCAGCRNDGCKDKEWCKSFSCCKEKRLDGCWECAEFPCENEMFAKPRVLTFARFIAAYGADKLMACLERNERNGIQYHYAGQLVGDYDLGSTEEEISRLILFGISATD